MVWDYGETNPFAGASGDLLGCVESLCEALEVLSSPTPGVVRQLDATSIPIDGPRMVFLDRSSLLRQHWLRGSVGFLLCMVATEHLNGFTRNLFSTLLVPKKQELVAAP